MQTRTITTEPFKGPDWTPDMLAELKANDNNLVIGSRIVSEEAGLRVWHLNVPPGARLPFHRHTRDYFWTILQDGKAKSRFGDGHVRLIDYRAGDTVHFAFANGESFIHDLENVGATDLIFVTVERL